MNKNRITTIAIVVLSLYASLGFAQERKIARNKVPAAVMKAFQTAYPHATIRGTNEEMKQGVAFYEIESKDGTTKRDLLYSADGALTELEEIIPLADAPEGVKNAIKSTYPNAKVKSVEKNVQGPVVHFEVLLAEKKKKNFEVIFNPDGSAVNP